MISDFPDSTTLLENARKEKLYLKLIVQIQKDFLLANITFGVKTDMTIGDLKGLLHEKIYLLIMERFDSYLNLLYVIDVPEKAFKEIEVTDAVEVSKQVSFLILKRELQKILLKEKYSS
ncbi:MAG: hypothetical protein WBB27_11205 [Maribacter sp.]